MEIEYLDIILRILMVVFVLLLFIAIFIPVYDFVVETPEESEHRKNCESQDLKYDELADKCYSSYTCDERPWQIKCEGVT